MANEHECIHEKDWDRKMEENKELKDSIIEILNIHNQGIDNRFNAVDQSIADKFDSIEKRMNKEAAEAKDAIRAALEAQKETVTVALTANDKAALKAEAAFEKRFDSIMELIGNVVEQIKAFIPRQEAESRFAGLNARIDLQATDINKIREVQSQGTGEKDASKYGISLIFSMLALGGMIVAFIIDIFIKK